MKFIVLLITTCYLLIVCAPKAHAQSQRSFTVSPPAVQANADPKASTQGLLKFTNNSSDELTFLVSIQDFIVTDNIGTPILSASGTLAKKFQASNWLTVDPPIFTLSPNQAQELVYKLRVPQDAVAGGHYAAVVYTPTAKDTDIKTGASVETKIGTLFYIKVKGVINENAIVTNFSANRFQEYGPITISTSIKNVGDIHISPAGNITVESLGTEKEYQNISKYNIFPQVSRDYQNTFGQKFMIGRFKATLTAYYGTNNSHLLTKTLYFWVIPWKLITILVLGIVAMILGLIYWFIRRRKKIPLL